MNTATFDTLAAVKALTRAGVAARHAEAITDTVRVAVSEGVATKADIHELEGNIHRLEESINRIDERVQRIEDHVHRLEERMATKDDLRRLEEKMQADLHGLEEKMQAGLHGLEEKTRADLAGLEARMTVRIYGVAAGIVAANTALMFALLKIFGAAS